MVLSKMTKEELELLKVDIQNELDTRTKEDKFKDGFDSHKIITSEECPDTKTRLIHNRKALPFDVNARHAMIKTRKKD